MRRESSCVTRSCMGLGPYDGDDFHEDDEVKTATTTTTTALFQSVLKPPRFLHVLLRRVAARGGGVGVGGRGRVGVGLLLRLPLLIRLLRQLTILLILILVRMIKVRIACFNHSTMVHMLFDADSVRRTAMLLEFSRIVAAWELP